MWPFRRRREETLNEMLLREAGLDEGHAEHAEPAAPFVHQPDSAYPAGQPHGVWAPSPSDTIAVVHAPGLAGDTVEFAALPGGDLVVDVEQGDADLGPLAEAIEQQVPPPYRAVGRRQEGDLWGLTASTIDVRSFAYEGADELELVLLGGDSTLTADGEQVEGTIPELEAAGSEAGAEYSVRAERLDGDLWEVRAAAL